MNNLLENPLFDAFAKASDSMYIYVTDISTDLSRWSKAAIDYFGLESEYFKDALNVWLSHIHPDDRQIYLDDIVAIFEGRAEIHDCQYRARNRYGEYVWVECKGSIIYRDDGTPSVFAGMMTRIDHQSKYDALTHLLTGYELFRTPFAESGSLMLLGIDGFRDINSHHGILYGNRVLLYLAELLSENIADADIYRFTGDEFVVYSSSKTVDDMSKEFGHIFKLCKEADASLGIAGFSISGGIVSLEKECNATEIMGKAELTLDYAKEQSSHQAAYSTQIEKMHMRRKMISEELNKSIRNNFEGFHLVYQPIFSDNGIKVVGCEALLRWNSNNKEIGPCFPNEFIPILEYNGGIIDVGYFVMQEAIKQAAQWQKKYKMFYVSFNVSYLQLEDSKFVPSVIETLDKYNVKEGMVLELTESVLADDTIMIRSSFEQLKEHGIQIALDDFGTGNSSLLTLHNININAVKLDQSFIKGLDRNDNFIDHAIIESVVQLCRRLGCKTIAEGVENDRIWKLIDEFQFSGLQGYLFSKPAVVDAFELVLDKYNMKL